jgi:hypothetical protein
MSRSEIFFQNQFGGWEHYQTKHNERDAFRAASARAASTGKRHKILDADGCLIDLIDP